MVVTLIRSVTPVVNRSEALHLCGSFMETRVVCLCEFQFLVLLDCLCNHLSCRVFYAFNFTHILALFLSLTDGAVELTLTRFQTFCLHFFKFPEIQFSVRKFKYVPAGLRASTWCNQ